MPQPDLTSKQVIKDLKKAIISRRRDNGIPYWREENREDFKGECHELKRHWNVSADNEVTAPGGRLGKPIIFAKKVVRRLLRWYINSFVDQQRYFNFKVTGAMEQMGLALADFDELTRKVEDYEAKQKEALRVEREKLRALEELAGKNQDAIAALEEKSAAAGHLLVQYQDKLEHGEKELAHILENLSELFKEKELLKEQDRTILEKVDNLRDSLSAGMDRAYRQYANEQQKVLERLASSEKQLELLHMRDASRETLLDHLQEQAEATSRTLDSIRHEAGTNQTFLEQLERQLESELTLVADRMRRVERFLKESSRETVGPAMEHLANGDRLQHSDFDYYLFENRFRGSRTEIGKGQERYLPFFKDKDNVLDLGCGRGEFVELLLENKIGVTGVDLNEDMVSYCQDRGLPVELGDLFVYLEAVPDQTLDGIFAAQVIEHMEFVDLVRLISLARSKLQVTGVLLLETINPRNLRAMAESFYLDLTHVKPVHPLTLKFLLQAEGFSRVDLTYCNPEKEGRIPHLDLGEEPRGNLEEFNRAVDRLNELLFGPHDYAAVAVK